MLPADLCSTIGPLGAAPDVLGVAGVLEAVDLGVLGFDLALASRSYLLISRAAILSSSSTSVGGGLERVPPGVLGLGLVAGSRRGSS